MHFYQSTHALSYENKTGCAVCDIQQLTSDMLCLWTRVLCYCLHYVGLIYIVIFMRTDVITVFIKNVSVFIIG